MRQARSTRPVAGHRALALAPHAFRRRVRLLWRRGWQSRPLSPNNSFKPTQLRGGNVLRLGRSYFAAAKPVGLTQALAPMNPYKPPRASVTEFDDVRPRRIVKFVAGLVFATGMLLTFSIASDLVISVKPPSFARHSPIAFFSCLSTLIVLGAAAPWWFPIAYVCRGRSLLAGALIASPQAATRFVLLADRMTSPIVTTTIVIETAGLVLVTAVGSYIAAKLTGR